MDTLAQILRPEVLGVMIPIVTVISVFTVIGLKSHYKHKERLAKIQAGMDPDAPPMVYDDMAEKI